MAIGHTRRLCTHSPNETISAYFQGHKTSHATRLELANIEAWLHEEGLRPPDNLHRYDATVKVQICKHSGDEMDPEKTTKQQEPIGGSADQSQEDDVFSEKTQTEELKLPNLDLVTTDVEKVKKVNKKTGAISKTTKKQPVAKSAPNSNQSVPDNLTKSLAHAERYPQKIPRRHNSLVTEDRQDNRGMGS